MENLSVEQAVKILEEVTGQVKLSRAEHNMVIQSLQLLAQLASRPDAPVENKPAMDVVVDSE